MEINISDVARICHEANRAYCAVLGDDSQEPWERAPEWQRTSAVRGVLFLLVNPSAPPSAQHDSWLAEKEAAGWKWGAVKDPEKKEHPCVVPYAQLPLSQRLKDVLFQQVAGSFISRLKWNGETAELI